MTFKDHFEVSNRTPLIEETKGKWVRLLPNIDLGHLLTMGGFAIALTVQWGAMDKRITIVEEQQKAITATLLDNRSIYNADSKERTADVKEIKELITQLRTTVAVTNYKIDQQSPSNSRK